ncbi:hypothetical protein GCM10009611_06570 [Arthrobacter roseus]
MRIKRQPSWGLPRYLVALCVILFFSGYFVLRFPDVPGTSIASYGFNLLIALPSLIGLWWQLGFRRAIVGIVSVALFAYLIEGFGTVTGVPYGNFEYGTALGPKVFGIVPYLLPLSYVPLVIGSVGMFAANSRRLHRILWATLFLVMVDGVLDPGAAMLGFWTWPGGGVYYGIPLSNYVGWLISGLVSVTLLTLIGGPALRTRTCRPELLDSMIASLTFWLGVTVFSGLVIPAVLAVLLLVVSVRRRIQLKHIAETVLSSADSDSSRRLI